MAGRHAPAGVSADALPQRTLPARPAQGILATPPSARDGRESAARVEGRPRGGPPEGHVHQTGVVGLGAGALLALGHGPGAPTAVGSPGTAHAQGLARMSRAGVELVGVKGLGYEWLATVERASAFAAASERDASAGIVL